MTQLQNMIVDLERWIGRAIVALEALRDLSSSFRSPDGQKCENCPNDQANFRPGYEVPLCDGCFDALLTLDRVAAAPTAPIKGESFVQTVKRAATPKARRVDPNSLHAKVLDILREDGEPMKPIAIVKASKSPDWSVRLALKELASDGKIIAQGATVNRTFALAGRKVLISAVVKGKRITEEHVIPDPAAPARAVLAYAGEALDAALQPGHSLDKRELLAFARKTFPLTAMESVELHLKMRQDEGKVERIVTAAGDRFRRTAKGGR